MMLNESETKRHAFLFLVLAAAPHSSFCDSVDRNELIPFPFFFFFLCVSVCLADRGFMSLKASRWKLKGTQSATAAHQNAVNANRFFFSCSDSIVKRG